MNTAFSTFTDISPQDAQLKAMPVTNNAQENGIKTENKSTEATQNLKEIDSKRQHRMERKELTKAKLNDKKDQREISLKSSDENIAKARLASEDANKEAMKFTRELEMQKTYNTKQVIKAEEKMDTAVEQAQSDRDLLESVKSVDSDGTETYYFPVPIEILTQLPPPGNFGLSKQVMNEIALNKDPTPPSAVEIKEEAIRINPRKADDTNQITVETNTPVDVNTTAEASGNTIEYGMNQ